MKTRVIQNEPNDDSPVPVAAPAPAGRASWVKRHRLATFFMLSYALAWWPWPLYELGIWPEPTFVAFAPLIAAIVVIALADGRAGFRDLGSRIIRWRVPWYWYAVALGLPLAVRFGTALFNGAAGGAAVPDWSELAWTSFALAFLVRLVNPADGPLAEEPSWRGYAVPRLQIDRSPLASAVILGVLVAVWHLPLVFLMDLNLIGIVTTFSITIVYVWLFNHARGSVLLTLLFHNAQGAIKPGDLGLAPSDANRLAWLECVVWTVVAIGLVALDRPAWRTPDRDAVYRDNRKGA